MRPFSLPKMMFLLEAFLSCSGKKGSKEAGIGEGLSVSSRAQTTPPLCTPPAQLRQEGEML